MEAEEMQEEELEEVDQDFYPEEESLGSEFGEKVKDSALEVAANIVVVAGASVIFVVGRRGKKRFDSWREARKASKAHEKQEAETNEASEK